VSERVKRSRSIKPVAFKHQAKIAAGVMRVHRQPDGGGEDQSVVVLPPDSERGFVSQLFLSALLQRCERFRNQRNGSDASRLRAVRRISIVFLVNGSVWYT